MIKCPEDVAASLGTLALSVGGMGADVSFQVAGNIEKLLARRALMRSLSYIRSTRRTSEYL
jgi:hypothetical protein